jgi:hypothetical protein
VCALFVGRFSGKASLRNLIGKLHWQTGDGGGRSLYVSTECGPEREDGTTKTLRQDVTRMESSSRGDLRAEGDGKPWSSCSIGLTWSCNILLKSV